MEFPELEARDRHRWLTKLHENVTVRRNVMFRLIGQSVQTLVIGNAGGLALILSFMPSRGENIHWLALLDISLFMLGLMFAAITQIILTTVAVKEAHAADVAIYRFIRDEMGPVEVSVYADKSAYKWANIGAVSGVLSILFLVAGALGGIFLLSIFL